LVLAHIDEGHVPSRLLPTAQRSASEVRSHLCIATDERYIDPEEFNTIYGQYDGLGVRNRAADRV
jgi:hypothetical protein